MRYRIVIFDNNKYENAIIGKSHWMTKERYDDAIKTAKKPSMFGNENFTIITETRDAICFEDCCCGSCKYHENCCGCDCDICDNYDCVICYCNKYEED